MNRNFYDIEPKDVTTTSTAFTIDERTGAVEWNLKRSSGRVGIVPELTLQDRRELAKTALKDEAYFVKAKRVYAANGGAKAIRKACGRSPSYAKQVLAAFNRAKKYTAKNQH